MNRHSLISAIVCCLSAVMPCRAALVSEEEAQQTAIEFIGSRCGFVGFHVPGKNNVCLKATRLKNHSDEAAFYIYETVHDGFVLISADDRTIPVLGYAQTGSYDENAMPENMRWWLDYITAQISDAPDYPAAPIQIQRRYNAVSPLLGNLGWGQDEPFNLQCPYIGTTQCVTGCVATATAQIMRYWQHPATGRGSHSYLWRGDTLKANFSEHSYNWLLMPERYISDRYSTDQANAVARLFSDIGIGCEMNYGIGGSSANETFAAKALVNYFDYDSALSIVRKNYIGAQAFEQTVIRELQANRPVLMGGNTPSGTGHAFVCDGINNDGLFHINWGWNGWWNGDFALTDLYPEGQGTGGGEAGEGYTEDLRALIGIQPNAGNAPQREITVEMMETDTDKDGLRRDESFSVVWSNLSNSGVFDWEGYLGVVICDAQMSILGSFSVNTSHVFKLSVFGYYPTLQLMPGSIGSSIPAGNYRLVTVFTQTPESGSWSPVLYQNGTYAAINITLTDDSVYFAETGYVSNLQAENLGNECMRFSWQPLLPADKYVVNVFYQSESYALFSSDTVTGTEVTVRAYYPGTLQYSWKVKALDNNSNVLGQKKGNDFVMTVNTDYTPSGLSHQVTEAGILFSWNGNAPAYQIEVSYNGELLYRQFPTETRHLMAYKEDGTYEWSVRSLNACGTMYVSEAATAQFRLPDAQGMEQTEETPNGGKFLRNGKVIIIKNGQQYDLSGKRNYGRHE